MSELKEQTGVIHVPKGSGIDGFLATIKALLRRPRLSAINIDSRGTIRFSYFAREDERALPSPEMDFETLMPMHFIRSNECAEIPEKADAAHAIASLFAAASKEMLYPIAFATSSASLFWKWHERTTGVALDKAEVYGFPLFLDDKIPEFVLLLCAGYNKDGTMQDIRKSFKIVIPEQETTHA